MKTRLIAMMLMAGGAMFAGTHVAIGVQIGSPAPVYVPAPAPVMVPAPAPVPVAAYRPPCPGPGYIWIDGYYDQYGAWYDGYWALPPYTGAYWVAPRYAGGSFYAGYWTGSRGFYQAAPRPVAPPPVYAHGPERGYNRPMPEANNRGFRDRGNVPERGPARGGEYRQGFRR